MHRNIHFQLALLTAVLLGSGCVETASEFDGTRVTQEALNSRVDRERTEKLIVEQTNAFRKQQGREAVKSNETLNKTARGFAEFMARTNKYGHNADGRQPSERAAAHGYDYCLILENIAWKYDSGGYETEPLATQFVTGWKESPGHRKNMLDSDVVETGVGIAHSQESGRYYAVQLFGRPKSQAIRFSLKNAAGRTVKYRLDEKTYTIEPRYIRKHTLCRPEPIALLSGGSEDAEVTQRFRPADGGRYVLQAQNGEVKAVQEK